MGMSIDEAIIQSRIQLAIWEEGCEAKLDNSPKAVETLIEIARKYQKIEKIIDNWNNQKINNIICCLDIREVIENGNVD